jgi:hypothetical protein
MFPISNLVRFQEGITMSLGTWIDRNDKRIRFLAWIGVGVWAVVATIIANVPAGTYTVTTDKVFPPQTTSPMTLSCKGRELAESWKIWSSNEKESAIYTSAQTPIMKDNIRVGYTLGVLNGAGSSNPRRPDVTVTFEVTCQYEHRGGPGL